MYYIYNISKVWQVYVCIYTLDQNRTHDPIVFSIIQIPISYVAGYIHGSS